MGLRAGLVPSSRRKRIIERKIGFDSLKLTEKAEIRPLGDTECLQLIRSAYAAYLPAAQGKGVLDNDHGALPTSDGAATPEAVDGRVAQLMPGDRGLTLVTHDHLPGVAMPAAVEDGVWDKTDNVLQ